MEAFFLSMFSGIGRALAQALLGGGAETYVLSTTRQTWKHSNKSCVDCYSFVDMAVPYPINYLRLKARVSQGKTYSPQWTAFQSPGMQTVCVNLADWDATRKAMEDIGPVHLLINNAAVAITQKSMPLTPEALDR